MLADADRLPTLATERLVLRWLTPADAPALLAVFGDAEVCRYWSSPPLPDLAAAAALQQEIAALFAARTLFQWGIATRDTGAIVGTATLAALAPAHGRAEVGYALARAAWGHGYAGEALDALVAFAFGPLGLRRLEADVDPRNDRSLRVLERAGFRREGLLRGRWVVAGEVQDAALYGLLRDEWAGGAAPRVRRLAVGLCVRPADGALLVEHGHDRVAGTRFLRAIGGGVEPGEDAGAAVVREWREELGLDVRAVRTLGTLDNRFVFEGRAGHEHVTVVEVAPHDPAVHAAERLEGCDPAGRRHVATWVTPAALRAGGPPLYPAGVLDLLAAGG